MLRQLSLAQKVKLIMLLAEYDLPLKDAYYGRIMLVDGDYGFYEPDVDDPSEAKEYFALKIHTSHGIEYYHRSVEESTLRLNRLKELNAPDILIENQQRLIKIAEFLEELKASYEAS